jgi:hypothetical protein
MVNNLECPIRYNNNKVTHHFTAIPDSIWFHYNSSLLILCIIFVPAEFSFFYRDNQLLEADLRGIQEEMSMNNFVL